MEADYTTLCRADELEPGEARAFEVNGRSVALFSTDEGFFATDLLCTHGQASLAEGFVEGTVVECPLHAGSFCLRTGTALSAPAQVPLRTYPVSVTDGIVAVKA